MGNITIRDVAAAAGVSYQTVSRVLNDRPDVAPETRQRVLEVIERLGYRPSTIARSLSRGRSCTLGVVSYGIKYFGPSTILSGIEQQANTLGYKLLLSLIRAPEKNDPQVLYDMVSYRVDGVIWAVPEIGDNRDWLPAEAHRLPVPVVFLDTRPRPTCSTVNVDNRHGGYLATRHLLAQGYRRIGLIAGPLTWWSARERKRGWEEAMQETGLPASPELVAEGNWSAASGEQAFTALVARHPELDAVFACNDQMALGVLKAARAMGRRVPDDLGVVGFDDIPEAAYFCPSLSTLRQDLAEMGRAAVRMLDQRITAGRQGHTNSDQAVILLPTELVVRESSGHPS
jgi:LacI family transcriptional regulator